jgi:predicted lipoprotein with Yx(FWY)xxD motif
VVRSHRVAVLSATGLVAALTLTGCGALDSLTGKGDDEGKATLVAVQNPQLGMILTDSKGRTVYSWDKDSVKPPTSNCLDDCTANWVPVLAKDQTTVLGLDPQLVGMIRRPDGDGMQLTVRGRPLYWFIKDKERGQVSGQGIAGAWWAVAPDGSKVKSGGQNGGAQNGGAQNGGAQNQAPAPGSGDPGTGDQGTDPGTDPGTGAGTGGGGGYGY